MKLVVKLLLAALSAAVLPEIGLAENAFYMFGGQCHTRPHELILSQPPLGNYFDIEHADFRDESFRGPYYYGFRYSHFFKDHPHFGLEFEFIHPKAILNTDRSSRLKGTYHNNPIDEIVTIDDYVDSFEISHGFNFLLANLAYRYGFFPTDQVPYGRLQLIARAGIGPTILHPESIVDDQERYIESGGFEFGELGFQLSPGIELTLYRGLSAFFEYKYTYTEIDHATIKYGEAKTVFETDHYAFGLACHF